MSGAMRRNCAARYEFAPSRMAAATSCIFGVPCGARFTWRAEPVRVDQAGHGHAEHQEERHQLDRG